MIFVKRKLGRLLLSNDGLIGMLLMSFGGIVLAATWDLSWTSAVGVGPGALPRVLAGLIIAAGILVTALSSFGESVSPESWRWRGIACVLGAVVLFALAIRPLGLLFAVPISFFCASSGSPESRIGETALSAAILTAASIGLFVMLLRLPIPVAPLLGW